MKISDDSITEGYFIRSYAPGRITVASLHNKPHNKELGEELATETDAGNQANIALPNSQLQEETLENSFILSANNLIKDWSPQSIDDLSEEHSQMLISLQPEVIILGTGASLRFPNPAWSTRFLEQHIGLEVMDTAAACRTYAILSADNRNVIAAMMLN